MGSKEEMRIFVGGLSWDTSERRLQDVFSRFGKVIDAQLPSGKDKRGMEAAIDEMHGRELDGREISVNKAEPKIGSDGSGYGYGGDRGGGGGYSSGGRGGYGTGKPDRGPASGGSDCFKCGRPGHWARDCPSAGGDGGGGKFSSRPRFSGSGGGGAREDRLGASDRYGSRYVDDRYDGGRYQSGRSDSGGRYDGGRYGDQDRERVDNRDGRYGGGRDRYASERNPPGGGERYSGERFGGGDRRPLNSSYGKERGSYRDGSASARNGDKYGGGGAGGPARYEGGAGYRDRPGPYDRPSRGGHPSSYDDRF